MRIAAFLYGIVSYGLGVAALLYFILFVGDLWVPKLIDSPPENAPLLSAAIDLALVLLFGLQHSVMSRPRFKTWWTRVVPKPIERSTFMLATASVLGFLYWLWQPIAGDVWRIDSVYLRTILNVSFWSGWAVLFLATFMINHFDLFGLRQVYLRLKDRPYTPVPFVQMAFYRFVRHPIMLGLLLGLWCTPDMSYGHLLFSATFTAYIFVGIRLEEHDTRAALGAAYDRYHRETPMLLPLPKRRPPQVIDSGR